MKTLKEFLNEARLDPRGNFIVKKNWPTEDMFWEYNDDDQLEELSKESVDIYDKYCEKAEEARWKTKKGKDGWVYYTIPKGTKLEYIGFDQAQPHMGKFSINNDPEWIIEIAHDLLNYGELAEYLKETK